MNPASPEIENRKPKKLLADSGFDNAASKIVLSKQ